MTDTRFAVTRRTFLYSASGAAGCIALNTGVTNLLCVPPLPVAFVSDGSQSLAGLNAVFLSGRFRVVAAFVSDPAAARAVSVLCNRHRRPVSIVLSNPLPAIESPLVEAIILNGSSQRLSSILKSGVEEGKHVFVVHPELIIDEAKETQSPSSTGTGLVHVAMLSSHDANVAEMMAMIRSGAIGRVLRTSVMGSRSQQWMWLEAMNIIRCATRSAVSNGDFSSPDLVPIRTVGSENIHLRRLVVMVHGTRGSIEIPGYSERDRFEGLPTVLDLLSDATTDRMGANLKLQETLAACSLFRSACIPVRTVRSQKVG
jgi:hypothetical protein